MYRYLIAIGSNQPRRRGNGPRRLVAEALSGVSELKILARAPTITTRPIGPSQRSYANSAVVVETSLDPPALLGLCKRLEREAGRRKGRRWSARPLDLDLILWNGGTWHARNLVIPHPEWTRRGFVLLPAAAIAATWRATNRPLTVRHHLARLRKPKPKTVKAG